ncbi:MAG: penicillin acylase family protein [Candidatus Dadabacteria bacterium]|nr:MAG: penicillin acylase family protein [Candidatus Dadabacteria bacterium]
MKRRRTLLPLLLTLLSCQTGGGPSAVRKLPIDETITGHKPPGAVRVVTDHLGIRHVYGDGLNAAIWGQGYMVARDRFFEMDMMRHLATGTVGAYVGELAFETDMAQRIYFLTRDGRKLEDALAERTRNEAPEVWSLLEAYAAGINAWLDDVRNERNGADLPLEYKHPLINVKADEIPDWTPQDTLALARLQAWSLSADPDAEIDRAYWRQKLGDAAFDDMFRFAPPSTATTLVPDAAIVARRETAQKSRLHRPRPSAALLEALHDAAGPRRALLPFARRDGLDIGSNNWIVTPQASASGNALLANDPHLALFNPSIWHVIHLDPNLNGGDLPSAQGVSFPGIPGIILGYTSFIAWGGTVAGYDVLDVYDEWIVGQTADGRPRVRHNGSDVDTIRVELTFDLKTSTRTVPVDIVPHHGPMIPDPDPEDDVDGLLSSRRSFRWTGHEVTLDPVFIRDLLLARNVEDAKAAIDYFSVGAQNWVIADTSGQTAYYPFALVPKRPSGYDYSAPVTGTGEADWTGGAEATDWFAASELPHADNPARGWLATANTDLRGELLDNDPFNDPGGYLYWDRAQGFRLERIQDLLSNRTGDRQTAALSLADLGRYQTDYYSKEAEYILPYLLAAVTAANTAESEALERLRGWMTGPDAFQMVAGVDPSDVRNDVPPATTATELKPDAAIAASLFYAWMNRLVPAIFADEFAEVGESMPTGSWTTRAVVHLLRDRGASSSGRTIHTAGNNGHSTLWDNRATTAVSETPADIIGAAFRMALSDLEQAFDSSDQNDWLWGRIHTVALQHFLSLADVSDNYDLGQHPPFPHHGGRFTVSPAHVSYNQTYSTDEPLIARSGPSKRFIVEMRPDGPIAYNSVPGGENGDGRDARGANGYDEIQPDRHYGDWLPDWLRGQRFRYRFTPAEVAGDAESVLTFE